MSTKGDIDADAEGEATSFSYSEDSEKQHWSDVSRAFLMYEDFMLHHIATRQSRLNNLSEGK